MKFVCLSDLHITCTNPENRTDNIEEVWKNKLGFVFDYCKKNNIGYILQAGDFFDKPKDWKTLWETLNFLKGWRIPLLTIFGQHDTYLYSEKTRNLTNLGILDLSDSAEVSIIGKYQIKDIVFQGCSYGQEIPEPVDNCYNILIIHKNISNKQLYFGHQYTSAKSFLKENNFDLIVCGDAHSFFIEKHKNRTIVNTGPLLRLEASKEMIDHKPCFIVFDLDNSSTEIIEIPHDKPDKVFTRFAIENKTETNKMLSEFIDSIKVKKENPLNIRETIAQIIHDNKVEKDVVDIISLEMGKE
jgi:DNA repair exonuclease SbcCD nuclease subunit